MNDNIIRESDVLFIHKSVNIIVLYINKYFLKCARYTRFNLRHRMLAYFNKIY